MMQPRTAASLALLALITPVLSGCFATPQPASGPPPAPPLQVLAPIRVDAAVPAREPALVALSSGALVVAGYWGPARYREKLPTELAVLQQAPLLWRSDDGGHSWQRLLVGTPADKALGNSDIDLAVGADGTLYAASLTFNNPANTLAVGASPDGGASWAWSLLAQGPLVDRPWIRAAPGGAHVVWNDGRTVQQATTRDSGKSWQALPALGVDGGAGGFDIDPGGILAVRVVPLRGGGFAPLGSQDGVAFSSDGGQTWNFRVLPGERQWSGLGEAPRDAPRSWDPVAFDAAGVSYASWVEKGAVMLARSADLGATWSSRVLAREDGVQPYYPFLRGGAAGQLVATWFAAASNGPEVAARGALVENASGELQTRIITLEADTGSSDHGEYFQAVRLSDGPLAAVVPVLRDGVQVLDYRVAR